MRRVLESSEIKQIAGRAGRFGTQYEHGEVTVLQSEDHTYLQKGLESLDKIISQACKEISESFLTLLNLVDLFFSSCSVD